jgi:hypothetical protein
MICICFLIVKLLSIEVIRRKIFNILYLYLMALVY